MAIGALALMSALALTIAASAARGAVPPASELAAQWWKWALEVPAAQSPLLDATGEFAAVGQSGPVWFLAGNFGGTSERTFTVPAGKPLFFPIANYFAGGFLHAPKAGGYPPDPIAYARALCAEGIAAVTSLVCEVDGVPIPITEANHEQSVAFALRLPPDNIFQAAPATVPATVDEGYYVLLAPLAPGLHTIHFATANSAGFSLDVTDYITVQ